MYRYRTNCKAIDDFLESFDGPRSALDELEARLEKIEDPYAAVAR